LPRVGDASRIVSRPSARSICHDDTEAVAAFDRLGPLADHVPTKLDGISSPSKGCEARTDATNSRRGRFIIEAGVYMETPQRS
jgi:hypothetical protein